MHSMLQIVSLVTGAIGTPLARKAYHLLRQKDFGDLVKLDVSPSDYARPDTYQADAQVIALFRKLEGLPTGVDLEAAALTSFYGCEAENARTNNRFALYLNWFERGFVGDKTDESLFLFLGEVRDVIRRILGPIPKDLVPRLSGGSTFYDRGDEITIPHKMESIPTVTQAAWDTIRDLWINTLWARVHPFNPEIIRGNRFTSVPKDSKKNRGICVEPSLNVSYQLALGAHLKERLSLVGIRISGDFGAQHVHRELARKGSLDGQCATIDLSNASDTVSYMLVKLLLPRGWFDLLSSLRSAETLIEGTWVKNHKFSSMGNGFTFELETLIFYALAISVARTNEGVSVYGDDIIVPVRSAPALVALLNLCGFTINKSKSFTDVLDPFRESCGGDYFMGWDVRPTFFKKSPCNPQEWTVLANQLTSIRRSLRGCCDDTQLTKAHRVAVGNIPTKYRFFGPSSLGHAVIWEDDRSLWRVREKHVLWDEERLPAGYSEIACLGTVSDRVRLSRFAPGSVLASALLGTSSQGPTPRDGIAGFKRVWQAL